MDREYVYMHTHEKVDVYLKYGAHCLETEEDDGASSWAHTMFHSKWNEWSILLQISMVKCVQKINRIGGIAGRRIHT